MACGRRWALLAAAVLTTAPVHVPAHRVEHPAVVRPLPVTPRRRPPRVVHVGATRSAVPAVSTPFPAPVPQSPPITSTPGATLPTGTPWATVALCETGGDWSMEGPIYSGGLGMLASTWAGYGGLAYAPTAGQATPAEQVTVARRVETPAPFSDTPAGGCQGW